MNTDEIITFLDELTSRLEGPARHVFELAVRQVTIESTLTLVVCAVLTVLGICLVIPVVRHLLKGLRRALEYKDYDSASDHRLGLLLVSAVVFIFSFVIGIFVWGALKALLNPEYAAIERLRGLLP